MKKLLTLALLLAVAASAAAADRNPRKKKRNRRKAKTEQVAAPAPAPDTAKPAEEEKPAEAVPVAEEEPGQDALDDPAALGALLLDRGELPAPLHLDLVRRERRVERDVGEQVHGGGEGVARRRERDPRGVHLRVHLDLGTETVDLAAEGRRGTRLGARGEQRAREPRCAAAAVGRESAAHEQVETHEFARAPRDEHAEPVREGRAFERGETGVRRLGHGRHLRAVGTRE